MDRKRLRAGAAALALFMGLPIALVAQDSVKGVTSEDAQHLQSLIDAYRRQDPLVVAKLKDDLYLAKGGPVDDRIGGSNS